MLRRIYRFFFNPTPLDGQIWRIDGIGLVELIQYRIKDADSNSLGKIWLRTHWKTRRVSSGQVFCFSPHQIRTNGDLFTPITLEGLQNMKKPV